MNETFTIGPLMKAARKFKKFNQSDVAGAIGCSQSALSKMEHDLLIPNAPQWFLFSRFTSIPPETIETGIIDRHTRVLLNNDSISLGYKLPKRYRLNRAQKIREIYPFLTYLEKNVDPEALKKFIETVGIDSEFFLDFDNLVNFQLPVDLMNLYYQLGKASDGDIKALVEFGQTQVYWDHFEEKWKKLANAREVFEAYAQNQSCFQVDFQVKVTYQENKMMIAYIPEPHLYHFLKDVGPEVKSFLGAYRKFTLENLILRTQGTKVEVRLMSERSNSPLENHYEVFYVS